MKMPNFVLLFLILSIQFADVKNDLYCSHDIN